MEGIVREDAPRKESRPSRRCRKRNSKTPTPKFDVFGSQLFASFIFRWCGRLGDGVLFLAGR